MLQAEFKSLITNGYVTSHPTDDPSSEEEKVNKLKTCNTSSTQLKQNTTSS